MYFIDVQGTLIDDKNRLPIAGSVEFIEELNSRSIPYVIITNNTKQESSKFLEYLRKIGLNIKEGAYLDPMMLLDSKIDGLDIAAYGSEEFIEVLRKKGYNLSYTNPDVVLVAIKEDFTASDYERMISFIIDGAKLIGMHETTLYAKNGKRYPGVGAILKMLSFATSSEYEVVGKPSLTFYNEALKQIRKQDKNVNYANITIISDDVKGDLLGAMDLGMKSVFVLSGKYTDADEIVPFLSKQEKPNLIFNNIQEFRASL